MTYASGGLIKRTRPHIIGEQCHCQAGAIMAGQRKGGPVAPKTYIVGKGDMELFVPTRPTPPQPRFEIHGARLSTGATWRWIKGLLARFR